MARTTEDIITTMDDEQAAQPALANLNSTSSTAIYGLWKYIVAQCSNFLETLWDRKQTELENTIAYGAPTSLIWLRSKAFEFQLGDTIELIDLVPQYPVIDTSKRIVTRCTVTQSSGVAYVAVGKGEPPQALTGPEIDAIQDYYTAAGNGTSQAVGIASAGQVVTIKSFDADLLMLDADITYLGKFAASIKDDCIAAIEDYLSNLGTSPTVRIIDLVNRLRSVNGFVDIFIHNMNLRENSTPWPGGVAMVTADQVYFSQSDTAAGYAIGETTATYTLADKLVFTALV